MTTPKTCANCGTTFETKRKDTMYCSDKCKIEAFKKRKVGQQPNLFASQPTPLPEQKIVPAKVPVMKAIELTPPNMDVASAFVINHQKEIIQQLRDELKDAQNQSKKLIEEKTELKEQIKDLQNTLDAKPSGLQGFISSNPSVVEKAIDLLGPTLVKLGEKFMDDAPKAIAGPPQQITEWFNKQSENVQKHFYELLQILASKPDEIENKLVEIKRSLMNVEKSVKQPQQSFR